MSVQSKRRNPKAQGVFWVECVTCGFPGVKVGRNRLGNAAMDPCAICNGRPAGHRPGATLGRSIPAAGGVR